MRKGGGTILGDQSELTCGDCFAGEWGSPASSDKGESGEASQTVDIQGFSLGKGKQRSSPVERGEAEKRGIYKNQCVEIY